MDRITLYQTFKLKLIIKDRPLKTNKKDHPLGSLNIF